MSINLAELYLYIRKTYPEVNVLQSAKVSYLESIAGTNNTVIFICNEDEIKSKENQYVPKKENANNENCNNDLDLTGSPLKDTCEIDTLDISFDKISPNLWSVHEEAYSAISLTKARNILCDYDLQKIGRGSLGSLWILCDATDTEKTIFLNINFEFEYNARGIIFYKGYISPTKLNSAEMYAIHTSQMPGLEKVQTSIDCYFNIKPNVSLKLSWSSSEQNPSLTNYLSSEVLLNQAVKVEESQSVAQDIWRQLQLLAIIKDDILDYKSGYREGEPIYKCGSGIDLNDLREEVMATMTDLPGFYDVDNAPDNSEIEAVIQKVKIRDPIDVTDKLWEILKRCSCYKDLKFAFHYVFQCAATCNIVNIPNNQNRLAEIIREVSEQRLAIPCLVGTEPMELLLEIGIEKIVKDYESIFVESKICGSSDLKSYLGSTNLQTNDFEKSTLNIRKSLYNAIPSVPIRRKTVLLKSNLEESSSEKELVGFQNSQFNKREIECKLARLAQIHLALEHLLLMQIHLNMENVYNQIFKDLMQNTPKPFDELIRDVYDKIEIPVSTNKVLRLLENKDPHARRIVMSSKTKFNEVQSTFYYSMDYIFPPNTFEGIPSADEKEMVKENMYHHWYYLNIKSKRC